MADRACKGTTRAGAPCKSPPLNDGEFCLSHAPAEVRESVGFIPDNGKGGRPRLPKPTEVARQLIEQNIATVLAPHFRTLGYELVIEGGEVSLIESGVGGAKVYGTSKDGDVVMSDYDDLGAMLTAAEKLLDRVYGRPRQAVEHTGEAGGPIQVAAFDLTRLDAEEKRALLALVEKAEGASDGD